MTKYILPLMLVCLFVSFGAAQSRLKVTTQEKKELFQLIKLSDAQIKEALENGNTAADLESAMTVEKRDVDGDRRPEYFIEIYSGGLCGALANCPDWVYQKTGNTYKLLLRTFGRELITEKTLTNKYRDLRSTGGDTAERNSFSIFKFDGEKYQAKNCFSRVFATRGKKEKIIPIKCGDEQ